MARPVHQAKLEGRRLRLKLKPGRQPHVQTITPDRAHLVYQRWPEEKAGLGSCAATRRTRATPSYRWDRRTMLPRQMATAPSLMNKPTLLPLPPPMPAPSSIYSPCVRRWNATSSSSRPRARASLIWSHVPRHTLFLLLGDAVVAELTSERLRRWLATLATMPKMLRSGRGARQQYGAEPNGDEAVRRRRASAKSGTHLCSRPR